MTLTLQEELMLRLAAAQLSEFMRVSLRNSKTDADVSFLPEQAGEIRRIMVRAEALAAAAFIEKNKP